MMCLPTWTEAAVKGGGGRWCAAPAHNEERSLHATRLSVRITSVSTFFILFFSSQNVSITLYYVTYTLLDALCIRVVIHIA